MLQPVGKDINTQSILADGPFLLTLVIIDVAPKVPAGCCIVSGMACDNVYRASVNLLAVEFADYL